ncbi:MAG: prenyltransferase [Thermoplasmatales archaeon]|nr:MAG: prenyltransferase [Thermoplasmatales archaeon]
MSGKIDEKKNIVLVFLTGFIRIRGVVNWSSFSFIGFILGMSSLDISSYIVPLIIFAVTIICILSFTFAINNYHDVDSDRKNLKKIQINAIASGIITKQTAAILIITFVVISLVISILFKFEIFLLCILILAWMWAYSSPPLRVKGKPGFDIIWHFFGFVLLVMWGSYISGSISLVNWLVAISIGIFSCIAQVWNHINDYSSDKDSGTLTFAVWAGFDTAKKTLKIIVLLHIIFLIPLILLYSLNYVLTIIILILGVIIGLVGVISKKDSLESSMYYFPVVFGGAVYISCIVSHINDLLGEPTLGLLHSIGII